MHPAPTIAERLDRLPLTRRHWMAVVVVGVGIFFDLYEVFLAGTLSTALTEDFHVTEGQLKPILASAFVGAFLGAILMTRVADRLGRRRAFYLTLGIYSAFSVLAAFSVNVDMLIICRFLAGVGIGGELPLCDAYLSDLLPARCRGRLIGWAYTIGFCGVPGAGFLALGLVPHTVLGFAGWRWMFLIGGLGAAVCWLLRRGLPESPRWLAAVGRHDEAAAVVDWFAASAGQRPEPVAAETEKQPVQHPPAAPATAPTTAPVKPAPMRELFAAPWRKRTVMLWVFQVLQVFGYYGFGTLAPLVLASKGYDIVHSLAFSALTFLGYPLGSLCSVFVIERMERKTLISASALIMLACGLAFGYCDEPALIIVFGTCYTIASNLFSNAFHVYSGELYPTTLRARGAGTGYSLSRLATAAMPYVLLPLLDSSGANGVFLVIGCAMAAIVLDVSLLGPRTTGRGLDDVAGRATDGASDSVTDSATDSVTGGATDPASPAPGTGTGPDPEAATHRQ
ncbi:MFS transporter [Streptomyces sp. Ru73]|uniref:MFS transporter n=1 Tax=Streptomyces sp. Ru73 TaxID=2080748 RepID=UPI000CDDF36A|nr:MFS transporter [Streptomyces sp. Ru73]POX42683.1 MFS transporter [Streptomyces sp. Ru73]